MAEERSLPPISESAFLQPLTRDKHRLFQWFFFGMFAFLIYQLLLILSLFSDIIIWAASLSLVFLPAHHFLLKHLPGRKNTPAALTTLGVLLLVLLPMLFIGWIVVVQSAQLYPTVLMWITAFRTEGMENVVSKMPEFMQEYWLRANAYIEQSALLSQFDLEEFMLSNINESSRMIANFGAATAGTILLGFVNVLAILVLMFFCFRDGARFVQWLLALIPMPYNHAEAVALRAYQTVTAVIRGAFLTALVQGAIAMVGYLIADVPLAIFFGVVTGFSAMIPLVGAALIWLPIGIFVLTQDPTWGIFVLAWGFFLVSLIDNFLKPILIGSQARMPILLIFCGIIGGANVYGITGLIVGPILIAVLLAFISIYREYYVQEVISKTTIITSSERNQTT
ncbi:MAG: AI-2E family transporter [Pseudomonadota bacterium]